MALAATIDPETRTNALVFFYSQKQGICNLAVELHSLTGGSSERYEDHCTTNSSSSASSQLAASTFLGTTRVYGVARLPVTVGSNDFANVVTQASPVFNPIDYPNNSQVQVDPQASIAVSSSSDGKTGYVSYLRGTTHLKTYKVTRSKTTSMTSNIDANQASQLASCTLNEEACVFYQDTNGDIRYRTPEKNMDYSVGDISVPEGSALGAAVVGENIWLYYRGSGKKIYCTYGRENVWSGSKRVEVTEPIDDDSSICLIPFVNDSTTDIHCFYRSLGSIVQVIKDTGGTM